MEILISVIIPVYNVEKYLTACIESVINQTYKNLEIILVDDGSSDYSGKICDEYADKDLRIKVIHKKNEGVSAARNDGIDQSSGELIYFLDADDWIDLCLFEEIIKSYTENECDAVFFDYFVEYTNKKLTEKSLNLSDELVTYSNSIEYLTSYMKNGYMWNAVYKTSIIKDNNISFKKNVSLLEDYLFKFTCYPFVKSYAYIKKAYYHYRQLDNSAFHSFRQDYPFNLKKIYHEMYFQIANGDYPPKAEIVPNSKYIGYLSRVAENAFQGNSLKTAQKIINDYINSNEYQKALLNYDKNIVGFAGRIYVKFKNLNWFIVWCVYILRIFKKYFR